uniref:Structural protein n=1 Tax=Rice ragged stunt virus TaxID=42475 RepID=F4YTU0_RRSV|nr:structural protein [Rice ragged stunt virus]
MDKFAEIRKRLKQKHNEWLQQTAAERIEQDAGIKMTARTIQGLRITRNSKNDESSLHVDSATDLEMDVTGASKFESKRETFDYRPNTSSSRIVLTPKSDDCKTEKKLVSGDDVTEISRPTSSSAVEISELPEVCVKVVFSQPCDVSRYPSDATKVRITKCDHANWRGWRSFLHALGICNREIQDSFLEQAASGCSAHVKDVVTAFDRGENLELLCAMAGVNVCLVNVSDEEIELIKISPEPLTCVVRIDFVGSEIKCLPCHATDAALASLFKTALRVYDYGRRIPWMHLSETVTFLSLDKTRTRVNVSNLCFDDGWRNIFEALNNDYPELYLVPENGDPEARSRCFIDPERQIEEEERYRAAKEAYLKRMNTPLEWWQEEVLTLTDGEREPKLDEFFFRTLLPRIIRQNAHCGDNPTEKLPMIGFGFDAIMKSRAERASQMSIGAKGNAGKEVGLPLRYKQHVINFRKREMHQKNSNIMTGYLPGGLLHDTLGGIVICLRLDIFEDTVISVYGIYNGMKLIRLICMICVYSGINIPGRPYFVYEVGEGVLLTPGMFEEYFTGARTVSRLTSTHGVIHLGKLERCVRQFNNYLSAFKIKPGEIIDRSRAPRCKAKEKKFVPRSVGKGVFYASDLANYPFEINRHDKRSGLFHVGEIDFQAAISSIWPQMMCHYMASEDREDKQDDEKSKSDNFLVPEAVDPSLVIPSAAIYDCGMSKVNPENAKVKTRGNKLLLPCGMLEHCRATSLTKHRCLLPYLGVLACDLPYGSERMPACLGCGRLYPQQILAKLCAQVRCPAWPSTSDCLIRSE